MTGIRRGWSHLAGGAGVGRVTGFVSNLLLSRFLGPTELGLFNIVSTTVQTSDTLVRCGCDYALNFELGADPDSTTTQSGAHLARGLTHICNLATAVTCALVAGWIWWGHGLLPSSLPGAHYTLLGILLLFMIALEGTSASAWEILLVKRQTASLALRQGLFFPLRLFLAACGALLSGVPGAMVGWIIVAVFQVLWLRSLLPDTWSPFRIIPFPVIAARQLLKRGFFFYASNLLASIIFYPLLLRVASASGIAEIGYLRVGQILQQLFAFLPSTLVPILFLTLRAKSCLKDQVGIIEEPFRFIWLLLNQVLFVYCIFDRLLIENFFGPDFLPSLLPTRLLLITALFECLAQLTVQPLLASGYTRMYGLWQNAAALLAAVLGWLWIPSTGLAAYLIVRLIYIIVPLLAFATPLVQYLKQPRKLISLALCSSGLLLMFLLQIFLDIHIIWSTYLCLSFFFTTLYQYRDDFTSLTALVRSRA